MSPRQQFTSTPYAIQAANAAVAGSANAVAAGNITGTLGAAQLPATVVTNGAGGVNISGTFTGDGTELTNVSGTWSVNGSSLYYNNGHVGVGNNNPQATLDVSGSAKISGLLRSGSETGTTDAPNPAGLVIRHLSSITQTSNSVVAVVTNRFGSAIYLVRDGSNGGFGIRYPDSPGRIIVAAMGMDLNAVQRNSYQIIFNPSAGGFLPMLYRFPKYRAFRLHVW